VSQASAGLREAGARLTNASRAVDNTDWLKTAAGRVADGDQGATISSAL
jgi:hypothetical protein